MLAGPFLPLLRLVSVRFGEMQAPKHVQAFAFRPWRVLAGESRGCFEETRLDSNERAHRLLPRFDLLTNRNPLCAGRRHCHARRIRCNCNAYPNCVVPTLHHRDNASHIAQHAAPDRAPQKKKNRPAFPDRAAEESVSFSSNGNPCLRWSRSACNCWLQSSAH